jgi:3-methylcrotonyl-CoA carboxylase alpha subunit
VGAGTVEFLVDPVTQDFYFCEMNTRLQVEHPVTEMITGLDLVELQLRVASGQPLGLKQEDVIANSRGCAVEARIYAENPQNDFLPSSGRLTHLRTPLENRNNQEPGVRVDSGVIAGNTVSTFYDPMIAKLIAFADTRPEALAKLERALRCYQVRAFSFIVAVVHVTNPSIIANTGRWPGQQHRLPREGGQAPRLHH